MSWSEELCRLCLTVSNVPLALTKDSLYNYVQNHDRIKIVDSGTVDGIESDRSLTRWVLLLPSDKDVQYLIDEVQNEQVKVDDKFFTISYQKAIACELPDHWEDTYKNMIDKNTHGTGEQTIPEQSEQAPNTDSFNAEPSPGQGNPAYPHPHMYPGGYPVGPYGAMSGFYVNVPQHENTPQGRMDQTNNRQVDQNTSGQIPQTQVPFMQMPHPSYNRFGPPRPGYPHQGQIQPQNQPTSQSNQNFPQDQSHMRGPFPYNVPFPGYPMYNPMGMPQGGNIPFHPGIMQMPMIFDQHSGQFVPVSSAGMPSAPPMSPLDSSKGSADEKRSVHSDPPPPYNSHEYGYSKPTEAKQRITEEHTDTTFTSRAILDQDKEFRKFRDQSFADNQDTSGEGDAQSEKESRVSQDTEDKRGESDATVERPTKILVSNLPSSVHEEFLELFFENTKKYGGGPVFNIELDEESASAVIEFNDPDALDIVLGKRPIKMMGQEIDVQIYVPEPPPPRCTIEVTGPPAVVNEDQLSLLEMYFENERRSGGGAVVEAVFNADKNMALITFESENVAMRVEERGTHSVKKQNVFVKLHIPETKQKKSKKTETEEERANVEVEQPKCIKIKGVDKSASRDTLEFYFENERRSGGGEIDAIKSDEEEDDVLYVTFKKPEVAMRVAEREHSVENQNLRAVLFVPPKPPPCYDDRVLIKGLNPSTTQDCLFNFIEAKTGLIPDKMDYHSETEGVAMVTFQMGQRDEDLDFNNLERVFSKNKLEGSNLKIARVPLSNCILVSNLASEITKDTVEFYFENVRKSGGGSVQKVVMNEDDSCLVFFQDYSVIDGVLQRQHSLGHQTLDVKRFQECLCKPEGEITERKLRIPEAIFLPDVDPSKIKFMKASKANKAAIEAQLGTCNTSIVWPNQQENVMLQCTITTKTPDCYKLVKMWHEEAKKNFEDFMKLIIVHKVQVLQEIWQKVMDELKAVSIDKPDAVALFVDKSDGTVTIVGNKPVADTLAKKVNEITIKVLEEAEKEKQRVKEVVTNLKPIETKMLLADKFPTKMESPYPDLKVKINQNKNEILFEGMVGEIQGAKLKMYEMKSSFAFTTVDSRPECTSGLYHLKQTKDYIVKKLKTKGVVAVWEMTDHNLTVVSVSEEQLKVSVSVLLESVVENSIPLKPASRTVLSSEQWQIKVDELHAAHTGKCIISVNENDSKIYVCGTDDIALEVLDRVKNHLRLHTVGEEKITCSRNIHRLIERFHKEEIVKVAKELQNYHVQIISLENYGGFQIRGAEDGIQKAKAKLDSIINSVRLREHFLQKPGLGEHMQTPRGKDSLNTIETQLKCVVTVKTDEDGVVDEFQLKGEAAANFRMKDVVITACCKAYDTRNIYTVKGDMTELTVDAFINPADDKLSLAGGLGKALLMKGGSDIVQECSEFIKSEQKLEDGEVFVSTAGNLQAQHIIHVIGPVWKEGRHKEEEMLSEAVFKCLMQASARNLKSIAVPAISCGSFGFPLKRGTLTIVQSVKNFFREVQESTLVDVYLCDVKQNTVDGFKEALGQEFGPHNVRNLQIATMSGKQSEDDSDEEEEYTRSSQGTQRLPQRVSTNESEVFVGNIKVSVVKGELAKQKVDLIVNTTAKNLDLKNGAVSLSLLKCGGPELQQEVSQKYPNGIKDGEIAVTSGQKLNCAAVVHTSLGNWEQEKAKACIKALHRLMISCLNVAEQQNLTSVAFPAVGTGNLGYPRDVVAAEMFAGVSQFSDNTQQPNVKEVRFIVYQKDFSTIKAFEDELRRWASGRRESVGGRERQLRKYNPYEDLRTGREQLMKDDVHQYEQLPDSPSSGDYKFGCVGVTVLTGDITTQDADCIVNSSNDSLDLSRGAVSQAIMKKGGKKLAQELKDLQSKMKKDHLVMTSAPGLQCKKIIHIVAKEKKEDWKDIVKKCLLEAEKEKLSSIAFPALGTAGVQMQASEIANVMAQAVIDFEKSQPVFLQYVRFVIFQQSMEEVFHSALKKQAGKNNRGVVTKFVQSVKGLWKGKKENNDDTYITHAKKKKKVDPNKVTFIILAFSEDTIDKAVKKLEIYVDREVHEKNFTDSIIKKMDENQMMEIKAIAREFNLEMNLQPDKGCLKICGMSANVISASDKIHRIMRDAATLEQQKNSAALLLSLVQWFFIEITETAQVLEKYEKDLNYKIETAYQSQAPNVKFTANKVNYILDFTKMVEYPEDDPTDVVTVIRRDLVKQDNFEQPPNWADMTGVSNLRVVILQNTDKEYQDIATKFSASVGIGVALTMIERIQNKTLWAQYQAKKKQLEGQNPPNTQNEKFLWHGTAPEAVDNINFHGFNRSYCGKNATAYGDGVYFAVNANYSARDTYSRPDASGTKKMYYSRVLTGVYTRGAGGMRVPPSKSGPGSTDLFDSVVDNPNSPGMYIIFHDTQAYPEYLVSFKRA